MTAPAEKLDLELLRKKDAGEFTRFVRLHERFVMGICQSLGLAASDCDDAAAEAFAAAYRALPQFHGDSLLFTWLYRIAYRTALRVRQRFALGAPSRQPRAGEELERADPPLPPADQTAEAHEAHAAVWRAVARLEPDQAVAVELFYRREMSVEQVAAIMEKPVGSVKTLLFRARQRLRMLLQSQESLA